MNKEEIFKNIVANLAGWKKRDYSYFNSENHLFEVIKAYTGWGIKKIKPLYDKLIRSNYMIFIDQQLLPCDWYDTNPFFIKNPEYILLTHTIKDRSLWLDYNDYQILVWINNRKNFIHKCLVEERKKKPLGFKESYYFASKTIAEELSLTIDQVRYSLKKLRNYFKDFQVKAERRERCSRKYKNSRSYTINLPPRCEWKNIIRNKVKELTNDESYRIIFPTIINNAKRLNLIRINEQRRKEKLNPMTLVAFSNMLGKNELQLELLDEGKKKWEEQREHWQILKDQLILRVEDLLEENKISIVGASKFELEINNLAYNGNIKELEKLINCKDLTPLII